MPLTPAPSTALTEAPVTVSAASATLVDAAPVAVAPVESVTVTLRAYVPSSEYAWLPLTALALGMLMLPGLVCPSPQAMVAV